MIPDRCYYLSPPLLQFYYLVVNCTCNNIKLIKLFLVAYVIRILWWSFIFKVLSWLLKFPIKCINKDLWNFMLKRKRLGFYLKVIDFLRKLDFELDEGWWSFLIESILIFSVLAPPLIFTSKSTILWWVATASPDSCNLCSSF